MRQRILGSHTPPCHRRMAITTWGEGGAVEGGSSQGSGGGGGCSCRGWGEGCSCRGSGGGGVPAGGRGGGCSCRGSGGGGSGRGSWGRPAIQGPGPAAPPPGSALGCGSACPATFIAFCPSCQCSALPLGVRRTQVHPSTLPPLATLALRALLGQAYIPVRGHSLPVLLWQQYGGGGRVGLCGIRSLVQRKLGTHSEIPLQHLVQNSQIVAQEQA